LSKGSEHNKAKPPQPPRIERQITFYRVQLIGMPFFIALPVFALAGLFDTRTSKVEAANGELRIEAEVPAYLRYRTRDPLEIRVTNKGSGPIGKLKIRLRRSYFKSFERAEFNPQPQEIEREFLVFEFKEVLPGESRAVEAELEANQPDVAHAEVRTEADGKEGPSLPFKTVIYP